MKDYITDTAKPHPRNYRFKLTIQLQDGNGNLTTHPKEVLKIISSYYQKLLSGPSSPHCPTPQTWLDALSLPKLTDEQLQTLNAPCKEEEIASIISSSKSSKKPWRVQRTIL